MPDYFSQRQGLAGPPPGTLYRDEVPISFRRFLLSFPHGRLHSAVSHALMEIVIGEVFQVWTDDYSYRVCEKYIKEADWFRIFDIIEGIHRHLAEKDAASRNVVREASLFGKEMNEAFLAHNIGWKLQYNGQLVIRGDEAFENTIKAAGQSLVEQSMPTAAGHLQSAISALSARPKANTSGAVAHATSAVECLLGALTGEAMTLGKYLDKHANLFHPALKKGLDGIYGFASDQGARHGKEGTEPAPEEAEFVVATCAAICTLLMKKRAGEVA